MPKLISACSTLPPTLMRMKGSVRAWTTRRNERLGPRGSFSTSSKPSMAYVVDITSRAERDLDHLYGKINAGHSEAALKWYRGLKEAIFCLEEYPNRCPVTRKKGGLRHLLYGDKPHIYRVI